MQADWEVEIGPGAPVIEAHWPGFVDLRQVPAEAQNLIEAQQLPALASVLARINAVNWPVWTSKCDFWPVTNPADFDPGELDAPPESAAHAYACYIDLLPRSDRQWTFPPMVVATCKHWCSLLHAIPLPSCRADFIVRRSHLPPNAWDHGVTAYFTACGPSPAQAQTVLSQTLAAFAHVLSPNSTLQ
jgi:hypothetical protein